MVVATVKNNDEKSISPNEVVTNIDPANNVVLDDYCLVGWDLDVTGRKLADEICHIGAYTPKNTFSLYIMPFRDFTPFASKRHSLRIVTIDYYRVLRDTTRNRMLKTKSEYAAIIDFLNWLESTNTESGKNGILLMCHETTSLNPHLMIKSLLKYNLFERFAKVVKGFVNCQRFAQKQCETTMVAFTMRVLAKVLLDKENVDISKANERAHLIYDIVHHLCADISELRSEVVSSNLETVRNVLPYTTTVDYEHKVASDDLSLLHRQQSLRPIFALFLKSEDDQERVNVLMLRRYLVDALLDYSSLKTRWVESGSEGLIKLIQEKCSVTKNECSILVDIIDNYFSMKSTPPIKSNIRKVHRKTKSVRKLLKTSDLKTSAKAGKSEVEINNNTSKTNVSKSKNKTKKNSTDTTETSEVSKPEKNIDEVDGKMSNTEDNEILVKDVVEPSRT